jgi:hypothetical protein
MKQDWTMRIYKADKRTKSGERLVSTTVWTGRDKAGIAREMHELKFSLYHPTDGYRIECDPKMKTVKNLMTGKDIEIDSDTPWCCNPASETYWSM